MRPESFRLGKYQPSEVLRPTRLDLNPYIGLIYTLQKVVMVKDKHLSDSRMSVQSGSALGRPDTSNSIYQSGSVPRKHRLVS